MKLKIFTDKSIIDQESVTIQLDRDGNKAEGVTLMIAKPEHGADTVEVLLPKAELLVALEQVVGDKLVLKGKWKALADRAERIRKQLVETQKDKDSLEKKMKEALDHLDRGNDIDAMGILRKTLRELS